MKIGQVITSTNNQLLQLAVGQKLAIQVISKESSGTGIISVGGKYIPAKIELSATEGQRFIVIVKEINSEGITLARVNPSAVDESLPPLALTRGLANDPNLSKLLLEFAQNKLNLKTLIAKDSANTLIPKWETISSQTIMTILGHLIKYLGLDYEQRIYRLFLREMSKSMRQTEIDDLRQSLKGRLLQSSEGAGSDKAILTSNNNSRLTGLRTILAQQLWLNPGTSDPAYFLLAIPIHDGQNLTEARIAITGTRKGRKVDSNHCRVGIEIESPNLGTVGADIWLHESQIHLAILCDKLASQEIDPDYLNQAKQQLSMIGLRLESLQFKSYANQKGFQDFIRGEQGRGVDVLG